MMTTEERAALTACVDALDEWLPAPESGEIGKVHRSRVALAAAEAVLREPAQSAPTADAVPWTGPVRVQEFDDGFEVVTQHGETGRWQLVARCWRSDYAVAIAAALNRDTAQAAEVAALRAELVGLQQEKERESARVEDQRQRCRQLAKHLGAAEALLREPMERLTAERDAALAALDRVLQRIVRHVDYDDPKERAWYELPDDGTMDVVRAVLRRA